MRNKSKIQESQLRSLIRNEITKIIKEQDDEQIPSKEKGADQKTPEKEEPKKDRSDVLEKITYNYIKSLKNNLQDVSSEELASAMNSIMGHFGLGKDSKIQIIQSLKSKIQF